MCLRIVLSNTYCVVFLFCFSSPSVPYPMLPVSLDCPFLIALSIFSKVYLYLGAITIQCFMKKTIVVIHCQMGTKMT